MADDVSGAITSEAGNAHKKKFEDAIFNDLNAPAAVALIQSTLTDAGLDVPQKLALIGTFDRVLGLKLLEESAAVPAEIPNEILVLVSQREEARTAADWGKADQIRGELKSLGWSVEDTPNGPRIGRI